MSADQFVPLRKAFKNVSEANKVFSVAKVSFANIRHCSVYCFFFQCCSQKKKAALNSLTQRMELASDQSAAAAKTVGAVEQSTLETSDREPWVELSDQQLVPSIETFLRWSAISYEESVQLLKLIKKDEISKANQVLRWQVDRMPLSAKEKCREFLSGLVESSAGQFAIYSVYQYH